MPLEQIRYSGAKSLQKRYMDDQLGWTEHENICVPSENSSWEATTGEAANNRALG